jgi:hypothetical protein
MSPAAQTNRAKFLALYEPELKRRVEAEPDQYAFAVDKVPAVAELMVAALKAGSANKDSAAIRVVCHKLGIKYTYEAIKEFLNS